MRKMNKANHWLPMKPHLLRRSSQTVFLGVCLWIGWRFVEFYFYSLSMGGPLVSRPPGVEAFLPISGLMSARYWLQTHIIHPVHPAGLLIFGAVVTVSFLFKRSFCSWVCPFGLVSEKLADMGCAVFGRNFLLPKRADWPLRSLKYLILGFFVWVIFFGMDLTGLREFLDSSYNKTADVRLLLFFLHPSTTTVAVLAALIGLSVLIRYFWCRYLCPYGALLGLVGLLSPARIKRNIPSCIECGKCARVCPASLPVNKLATVHSDECSLCLECVQSCPVADTLSVGAAFSRFRIGPLLIASTIALIFLFTFILGKACGHWQTSVTPDQAARQIKQLQYILP
ncbi:MAG: 4Fe-4S binding protein [Candidatus Omnitrophica bacterium]|nr:4Fe-4S binding protein [Candidatus Omnitrophota bacterium]MDE2008838.1 4Fe-4S binding protein [Candidatus Omnitrophota bacterium]MDE2213599.1 4Fe-4S binding protein [Candidatus Omnitrophota bacterium]MDE2230500.1 4Fe-4S binding protein [Candidatus Omnitrophota bacterium]